MVKKTVPKKLAFMSIYFLGINGIIGSGAFLLPQSIYKDMNLLSVIVLLSAALTVLCRFGESFYRIRSCMAIFI